jgi:thiamine biosynthesis lipoprotein
MAAERRFRAMGSDCHIIVVGGSDGLLDDGVAMVAEFEERWSRFLPFSEISRLNRHAGRALTVSADTLALVELAVDGWNRTGGRFDPTVLGDLARAGYDRSFEHIAEPRPDRSTLVRGCGDIVIDHRAQTVTIPPGVGFDPGGLGKGFAADLVAERLFARGAKGVCVNLGGDVRVVGRPPVGPSWTVAVVHPFSGETVATIDLFDGAVATSSRTRRVWSTADGPAHHLIDPTTGRSAWADLASVTVVAADAGEAEILSKDAFLAGRARALELVADAGAHALLVADDGQIETSPALAEYLAPYDGERAGKVPA